MLQYCFRSLFEFSFSSATHSLGVMRYAEARGRLRSASSSSVIVRRTWLSTVVGLRAFPVAASRVWKETTTPRHVCTVHANFLQSSEDSSFQPSFL